MAADQMTIAGRAVRLAVLIDADNVRASAAKAILNEIASFGDPSLRRVYGDWSSAALTQIHPDFDSRTYGSAKLSDLLKRTGRLDLQKGPSGQMLVRDKA